MERAKLFINDKMKRTYIYLFECNLQNNVIRSKKFFLQTKLSFDYKTMVLIFGSKAMV